MYASSRRNRSTVITDEDVVRFVARLRVTPEEIRAAQELGQRDPDWFKARADRLSASNYGAAAGHNDWCTPRQLLQKMLWPQPFSNDATDYGTWMEPTSSTITQIAVANTLRKYGYADVWFEDTGTLISEEHPWLCASADNIVRATGGPDNKGLRGVVELKAPYRKKEFYPTVPHYYYDQFQGQANLHGVDFAVFAVYTPQATQINYYRRNVDYWEKELFPLLKNFYMRAYVPLAIYKERGLLPEGAIELTPICVGVRFPASKSEKEPSRDSTECEPADAITT